MNPMGMLTACCWSATLTYAGLQRRCVCAWICLPSPPQPGGTGSIYDRGGISSPASHGGPSPPLTRWWTTHPHERPDGWLFNGAAIYDFPAQILYTAFLPEAAGIAQVAAGAARGGGRAVPRRQQHSR